MRYLGLDVGQRWIGLALGDAQSRLSTPLRTMRRTSRAADVETLRRVCDDEGVGALVIGLPQNMDGSLGAQAAYTQSFGQSLERLLGHPVYYCDERLSTAAAEEYVVSHRGRPLKRGERVDHVAAALILQDFFDQNQE